MSESKMCECKKKHYIMVYEYVVKQCNQYKWFKCKPI